MDIVAAHLSRRTFASETAKKVQSLRDAAHAESIRQESAVETLQAVRSFVALQSEEDRKAGEQWCDKRLADASRVYHGQLGRLAMGDMVLQILEADFHQAGATLQSIQQGLEGDPPSKSAKHARRLKTEKRLPGAANS